MDIKYYRKRIIGKESFLEDILTEQLNTIFNGNEKQPWIAGSVPIGASKPDLLVVFYDDEIDLNISFDSWTINLLAFLRSVGKIEIKQANQILGTSKKKFNESLLNMLDKKIIFRNNNLISISPKWKNILHEIITVEIKVSDWKRAIQQAQSNKIFAHKSYIALPERIAQNIQESPILSKAGIGLISITDKSNVEILIEPQYCSPKIWSYYYKIASQVCYSEMVKEHAF